MIRIACVGTRPPRHGFGDYARSVRDFEVIIDDVVRVLSRRLARGPFVIVTGGADGVDQAAEAFGTSRGLHVIVIEPDYMGPWPRRAAPIIRNGVIANEADAMIAWPKRNRQGGTENAIDWARKWDRPLVVREPWATVPDATPARPARRGTT